LAPNFEEEVIVSWNPKRRTYILVPSILLSI
jgi:hypothetical protein